MHALEGAVRAHSLSSTKQGQREEGLISRGELIIYT